MDRVVLVGTTGAGKSTFGARLAGVLDIRHIELDSLYWAADWTPVGEAEFERAIRSAVAGERWLIDGNYSRMRELIWPQATHVIWLNYSFTRVMYQLIMRTIRRAVYREELFSGNRESVQRSFFSRESILLWGLKTYRRRKREYERIIRLNKYPDLDFVVLANPADAQLFLDDLRRLREGSSARE